MLQFLFLPLLATAEWVEISQNHYRKDSVYKFPQIHEETTNKVIYNNHSIAEHEWSRGYVQRIPSNSIKRIQNSKRKPPVITERNPIHHVGLTTEKSERISEITKWKSGNAMIERVDHKDLFRDHHITSPATRQINENALKNKDIKTTSIGEDYTTNNEYKYNNITDRPKILQKDYIKGDIDFKKIIDNGQIITTSINNKDTKPNELNGDKKDQPTLKISDKTKTNTRNNAMVALVKFLKVVSQTINQNTKRSFNDKVRYLEDLKTSILASIEEHIDTAFPDDNTEQQRSRRASGSEPREHVEFPSSESALMSISFLTFAVFLIKLVLQVIHTYKAKTMMVTPAVVATVGRAAATFKKPTSN